MARDLFRAWTKYLALVIATSPPRNGWSAPIAHRPARRAEEVIGFAISGNPVFIAPPARPSGARSRRHFDFRYHFRYFRAQRSAEIRNGAQAAAASNPARRSLTNRGAVLVARNSRGTLSASSIFSRPSMLPSPDSSSASLLTYPFRRQHFPRRLERETFGDYATGTNHALPTGGVARARGGFSATDFVKCISVQEVTRGGSRASRRSPKSLPGRKASRRRRSVTGRQ